MRFLLDTNVVSEPGRRRPDPRVLGWLEQHLAAGLLSVVTLGELESGAHRLPPDDPRRTRLLEWIAVTTAEFDSRVLDIDSETAREWGRLQARLAAAPIGVSDALIAATALVHDLTLATRNVQHFDRTGVRLVNPFEA